MSILADTTSMLAGCLVASIYPGLGAPADVILAASADGDSGAGPLADLGLVSGTDYFWVVTSAPADGSLVIYEDGSFSHTGAADGEWPWVADVYAGGVLQWSLTVTDQFGTIEEPTVPSEPVTLAEAKLAARIDDSTRDALINGLITSARLDAEHITGREFVSKTKRFTFADWPSAAVIMPMFEPTGVAISYWSGTAWTTLATDAYVWFEQGTGTGIAPVLSGSWPALGAIAGGARVRVDVTAGPSNPATSPEPVKLYIKALVAWWVDNPSAVAAGNLQEAPFLRNLLDPVRLWA